MHRSMHKSTFDELSELIRLLMLFMDDFLSATDRSVSFSDFNC